MELLDSARLSLNFIFYRNLLKNFQPNYYEKNTNLYNSYLNSQNNFYYTQDEYNMFQNFNFQNDCDDYTSKTNNMLQNYKKSSFEESDSFEENSFFQDNVFDEETFIVEIPEHTNLKIFEKQTFPFISTYNNIERRDCYKNLPKIYAVNHFHMQAEKRNKHKSISHGCRGKK